MTIHENLREQIKKALKAHDKATLRSVRNLLTALTNESVAKGKTPQDILTDEEALVVIKRLAKQRKESIEQFRAGEREDLVGPEQEELEYLEQYLPEMMSKEEIKKIAEAKKAELGVEDKTKMGILMGAIMKEVAGKADGKDVKEVVEKILG